MSIKEITYLLKRNIKLVVILPLVFGVLSAVVAWCFLPNQYTAQMAVYVLTQKYSEDITPNTYWEGSFQEAYHDVLTSQQISNDVAKLSLTNRILDEVKNELKVYDLDSYNLDVESSEKNRVITYRVTNQDANKALNAVEAWTNKVSSLAKEVTSVENIVIVDEPKVPDEPSGPHRILITFISIIVGLVIALFIIFLKDALNKKILCADDIAEIFQLKVLSEVPRF